MTKCHWCGSTKTTMISRKRNDKRKYPDWRKLHGFDICTKCYSKMKYNVKKRDIE